MSEEDERLLRGPKGERGPEGQQGAPGPGMTIGARHAVVFLFVFTLLLAGANLFWTAHQVHVSTRQIRAVTATVGQLHAAEVSFCQAANQARAQQVALWMYVIGLGKPPATAQGRALIARFEHHLKLVFAPRNCKRLGSHAS